MELAPASPSGLLALAQHRLGWGNDLNQSVGDWLCQLCQWPFFDRPIPNSPYDYPTRYWELDEAGQPTQTSTMTLGFMTSKSITRTPFQLGCCCTGCSPFCLQHLNDLT